MRWTMMLAVLTACSGGDASDTEPSSDTNSTSDTEASDACEMEEMECVDEMILDLSLHDDQVSDGAITNSDEGDYWVTTFDASAGGYSSAADNPWLYMRFTADGVEQVEIDDETALEDNQWHLGARRFILRLNGGSSGPSCVGAAAFLESSFEDLTEVPDGMTYYQDDYYTSDCTIVNDSSGLPGSPQVALAPWWAYSSCVETTDVPFLIELEDGKVIRMVIDAYYDEGQEDCNSTGSTSGESAFYTMRWSFVE